MGRITDLHPDDAAARRHLITQLRRIRETQGLSRADLAHALGATTDAIANRELKAHNNPHINTVQAHAAALGHRLTMRPVLTPELPVHPGVAALRAMAEGHPDPDMADEYHRSVVLHTMVAHRRWLGITARDLMTRLGGSRDSGALSAIETEVKQPQLATFQRYARALGGHLHLDLQPLNNEAEGVA